MGLSNQVVQLEVKASAAAGAAQAVGPFQLSGAALVVNGTFAATMQVQGSIDGGLTWTNWVGFTGTAVGNITSPGGVFLLGGDATHVRINTSVYTSGQPVAYLMFPPILARADRRMAP